MRTKIDYSKVSVLSTGDLYILRCFRRTNIPCIYAAEGHKNSGFYSRYNSESWVVPSPRSEPERFIDYLMVHGKKHNERPVLFFGGDLMLMLISRNRGKLEKYYRFLLPPSEMVEDLLDKERFNEVAVNNRLTVPRTIKSSELKSNDNLANKLIFPCVIKPNMREWPSQKVTWFQTDVISNKHYGAGKVLVIRSLEEYLDVVSEVRKYSDNFIVQEYIDGKDDQIFSFHSYVNQSGHLLGYYVGRKIRTLPKLTGISTCLALDNNEKIINEGINILKKLNLIGVSKMDFKIDERTDKCFLMEINTRFNLWNYLGAECGVNLPLLAYNDLVGANTQKQFTWRTDIKWINFEEDFRAYLREYGPAGEENLLSWLKSISGKSVHPVFSWLDPIPAVIDGQSFIKRAVKSIYNKVRKQG